MASNRYVKERWRYQERDEEAQEAKATVLKDQMDKAMNDPALLKLLRKSSRR